MGWLALLLYQVLLRLPLLVRVLLQMQPCRLLL
jgi:hypothetical protein